MNITPLKEGELEVLGFVYNLCVDSSQQKGATSPIPSSASKANLLSMSVNSRESLYQVIIMKVIGGEGGKKVYIKRACHNTTPLIV